MRFELLGRVGRGLPNLVPGLPNRNSAPRTPLLLAYQNLLGPLTGLPK